MRAKLLTVLDKLESTKVLGLSPHSTPPSKKVDFAFVSTMLSGIAVLFISIGVLLFFDAYAIRSSGSAAVVERLVEGISAWLVAALCLFRALWSALKWRQLKRTSAGLDAEPAVRLKARAKSAISVGQALALLLIFGLLVEWLAPSDLEKANSEQAKAEIEAEYQDAQHTVLEDLAGSIPESEPNLAVVSRDGRVVRINKRSGAWCILIENPSNPLPYFSCSEIDKRAQRVREQKSLSNRLRHFFNREH